MQSHSETRVPPYEELKRIQTRERILVIDDDPSFQLWLSRFLEQNGFEPDAVDSVEAAEEKISDFQYSVVIADVNLPGNDQLQFVKHLVASNPQLSVILVTGQPSLDSAIRSLELPVVAYLTKPFQSSELLTHIKTSILRSTICRNIGRSRERIMEWLNQLNSLDELLQIRPPAYDTAVPADVYITLTLHNILEPLFDLKHLTESLARGKSSEASNVCDLFKCPRLDQQRHLLDHSVDILEKTKQSFKSKELGDLRKKLEKFLQVID